MGLLSHSACGPQRTPSHFLLASRPHTSKGSNSRCHGWELLDERHSRVQAYTTMEAVLEFGADSLAEAGS